MVCTNRSNFRVVKQHIPSLPHQSSHKPCPCPSQKQDAVRNGASLWSGIVLLWLQEILKYRTKKLRLHAMLFVVVKPVPDKARLPVRVSSLWPLFLVIIHSLSATLAFGLNGKPGLQEGKQKRLFQSFFFTREQCNVGMLCIVGAPGHSTELITQELQCIHLKNKRELLRYGSKTSYPGPG